MAVKRKKQARRKDEPAVPGYVWLFAGLLIGGAIAVTAWVKMPHAVDDLMPHPNPAAQPQNAAASTATPDGNPAAPATVVKKPKYDFYTLLPEKEVVIPDEELSAQVKAEAAANLAAKQQAALASAASSAGTDGGSSNIPVTTNVAHPITPSATAVTSTASVTTTTAKAPTSETFHPATAVSTTAANTATPSTAPASTAVAATPTSAVPEQSGQYLLQAGAFKNTAQADDLKARIAMLGLVGRVEDVQTPAGEMHRVRLGPYATASELNAAKQKLSGGGLPAVAIRVK